MSSTSDVDKLCRQGRRLLRDGKHADAVGVFQQVIAADEHHVPAREALAAAFFSLDDYDAAIATYTEITRLDPRQGRALVNLGAIYNRKRDFAKAIDVLRRGVQKDRSCAQGYYNMGLAHRGMKQYSMAVSAYREALRVDPKMAEAHQNLANVFVDMHNYQQAIVHYEKALVLKPEFPRAQRGLERAQEAVNQRQQSASPFGRLVDAMAPAEKQVTRISLRDRSDEEREQDRRTIAGLAAQIETAAVEFLELFRKQLEPSLLTLNRAVTEVGASPFALIQPHQIYQEVLQRSSALRKVLKNRMDDVQVHLDNMQTGTDSSKTPR